MLFCCFVCVRGGSLIVVVFSKLVVSFVLVVADFRLGFICLMLFAFCDVVCLLSCYCLFCLC